jgi:hypothetical protein
LTGVNGSTAVRSKRANEPCARLMIATAQQSLQ